MFLDQGIDSASKLMQDHGLDVIGHKQGSLEIAFASDTKVMEEIVPYFEGSPMLHLRWYEVGKCEIPCSLPATVP